MLLFQEGILLSQLLTQLMELPSHHLQIMSVERLSQPVFLTLEHSHMLLFLSQTHMVVRLVTWVVLSQCLNSPIAGHNLKNKLGRIKFGNRDINTKIIYS